MWHTNNEHSLTKIHIYDNAQIANNLSIIIKNNLNFPQKIVFIQNNSIVTQILYELHLEMCIATVPYTSM